MPISSHRKSEMYCCPSCFSDSVLQDYIFIVSRSKGKCSYCKTKDMNLIEPAKLLDLFEPVLGLYRKDTKGLSLNEILQTDWHVFAVKKDEIQNKLLR